MSRFFHLSSLMLIITLLVPSALTETDANVETPFVPFKILLITLFITLFYPRPMTRGWLKARNGTIIALV